MIIRGCKSISEYAFRRWMDDNGFVDRYFTLEVDGNNGTITDRTGEALHLVYDSTEPRVILDNQYKEA